MTSVNFIGKFDPTKYNHVISEIQLKFLQTKINSIVVGTLLGDGGIAQPKKGKPYYKYKQSIVHAEYLAFLYFIFKIIYIVFIHFIHLLFILTFK